MRAYFKRDETLRFYGVALPAVRIMARDLWARHRRDWSAATAVRFCDTLIREAEFEAKAVGVMVLSRWHRHVPRGLLRTVRGWLGAGHCASWAAVDLVAPDLVTPLLRRHPDLVPVVARWTGARSLWVRRAAAVTFVPFARHGEHLDTAYGIAERLFPDPHDLIHKAVGWMLREAGKTDPRRLDLFLRRHGPRIPRTTLRYAIERFPPARRAALLRENPRRPSFLMSRIPEIPMRMLVLVLFLAAPSLAAAQQVLTPERLVQLIRVSPPAVSPDGATLVFGVRTTDLAANRGNTNLVRLPAAGGEPVQLTDWEGSEYGQQWRLDGRRLGFLSARSGAVQLWEIHPDGSDARQVTDIEGGIDNFRYAPSGTHVSFTRRVKLDQSTLDRHPDLPKASARIIDELMYRHWDTWRDYDYNHLFVAPYRDGTIGEPVDVMPGERWDTPLMPFGGVEQINWSPDGTVVAYTAKKLTGAAAARSTNADIYLYDLATGRTTNVTSGMMGYDVEPVFSPDGKSLAWLSMERDGFEADRSRLFVRDLATGRNRELTGSFDRDVISPVWSSDSRTIYFLAVTEATEQLFAADPAAGTVRRITTGLHNYTDVAVARVSNRPVLIAGRQSISAPTELFRVNPANGEAAALTRYNAAALSGLSLGSVERRMVKATDGAEVLTWVIYPPGFDSSRTYPAILYAQGGPQSPVSQFFSYRWNFQALAANGYIVVAPNRRGVPGFGQAYKEQISGDWGGQAMRDLLAAIDEVAREPYVDRNRLGAVGASFGGYSVFWLAGHHEGRFKTFIAHDGVFNLESMYGATEEIFFPTFDLEGAYWDRPTPKSYEAFSPHRFVDKWDTPMLVIHGEQDFRVPVTEGMQAFTALQLKGIESRFLYFPEENHWVLQPQNSVLWHRVFYDWLGRFLKPAGT